MTPFHSRPNTPTARLSALTWEQGPTAFFSQGVPFSYGIGPVLAQRILQFLPDVACPRVLEMGAGLGYLSKHVLEQVGARNVGARDAPVQDGQKKCEWYVSDGSPALLKHWEQSGLFASHAHVKTHLLDITAPFSWETPLDLIFMSYVIDSTPTCHMMWKDGQLYEWVIETKGPGAYPNDPWQAPAVFPLYQERWHRISATESRYLTPEDYLFLESFFKKNRGDWGHSPQKNRETQGEALCLFNYSPMLKYRLADWLEALSPDGKLVIHDFGYHQLSGAQTPQDLCTQFGAIQAYPMYFPLLEAMCADLGYTFWASPAGEGQSTLVVIGMQPVSEQAQVADAALLQAEDVEQLLNKNVLSEHHGDYALMSHMAMQATGDAQRLLLDAAIARYPDIAIPNYGQYADLLVAEGKLGDAQRLLEGAVQRIPLDPTLGVSLANVLLRQGKKDAAIQRIRDVLPRTTPPLSDHLQKLLGLLLT